MYTCYLPKLLSHFAGQENFTGKDGNPPVVSGQAKDNPLVTNNPPAISIPPVPAVMTITSK